MQGSICLPIFTPHATQSSPPSPLPLLPSPPLTGEGCVGVQLPHPSLVRGGEGRSGRGEGGELCVACGVKMGKQMLPCMH